MSSLGHSSKKTCDSLLECADFGALLLDFRDTLTKKHTILCQSVLNCQAPVNLCSIEMEGIVEVIGYMCFLSG